MQLPLIEIRDQRQKEWFWVDNEFLNGTAKLVGPLATLVYVALCRHSSNDTQSCFPSMETLADETGIKSRNTVAKAIKVLEKHSIIQVEKRYNTRTQKRESNVYFLLSRKYWKTATPEAVSSEPKNEVVVKSTLPLEVKKAEPQIEIPVGINLEAWDAWVRYRKEIKKKMTPMTQKQQLKFLAQNVPDHLEIIRNSIRNGWTGLFPVKKDKPKEFTPRPPSTSYSSRNRDYAEAHRKRMEKEAEDREFEENSKHNDMLRQIKEMTGQLQNKFTMK